MPSIVHATVRLQPMTHMVKDQVMNGFTFSCTDSPPLTLAASVASALELFYTDGLPESIGSFLSESIDRATPATIDIYELSSTSATDPTVEVPRGFGSPILSHDFTVPPAATAASLPNQVAMCLSMHSAKGTAREHSGPGPRPAERTRGRVYIGPLCYSAAVNDPTTKDARLAGAAISALGYVAARLNVIPAASPDRTWCVWSRVDNKVRPVTGGFIDNEFDIQRRRGEKATFRQLWGAAA